MVAVSSGRTATTSGGEGTAVAVANGSTSRVAASTMFCSRLSRNHFSWLWLRTVSRTRTAPGAFSEVLATPDVARRISPCGESGGNGYTAVRVCAGSALVNVVVEGV